MLSSITAHLKERNEYQSKVDLIGVLLPFRSASHRCKSSQTLHNHWSTSQTAVLIVIVLIMVLVLKKKSTPKTVFFSQCVDGIKNTFYKVTSRLSSMSFV